MGGYPRTRRWGGFIVIGATQYGPENAGAVEWLLSRLLNHLFGSLLLNELSHSAYGLKPDNDPVHFYYLAYGLKGTRPMEGAYHQVAVNEIPLLQELGDDFYALVSG
jgi:hypothetical protein